MATQNFTLQSWQSFLLHSLFTGIGLLAGIPWFSCFSLNTALQSDVAEEAEVRVRCAGRLPACSLYGFLATGGTEGFTCDTVGLPVLATVASERKFLAALSGECLWLLMLRVFAFGCLVGARRSLLKSF